MNTSKKYKFEDGTIEWKNNNGDFHRTDGPAIIDSDGEEVWYKNGLLHREDGPAIIFTDGELRWYNNDVLHREDGPALIHSNGEEEYWLDGSKHDPITFLIKSYEYIKETHN